MTKPFSSLLQHKRHAQIVGNLLISYGEIEFDVVACLAEVFESITQALQIMFRVRSETARIQIADAIMRPKFTALEIDKYDHFILAVHHCISIRNQYAHCHWNHYGKKLFFTNLEIFASPRETPPHGLRKFSVNLDLLKRQQAYFRYVQEGLWYLQAEYQKKIGAIPDHDWPVPKEIGKPPKHIGQGKQAHPKTKKSRPPNRKAGIRAKE